MNALLSGKYEILLRQPPLIAKRAPSDNANAINILFGCHLKPI